MYTVVSFHAHPDDEALLTGGTLARAAAEGHRVVIVFATDGEAGLSEGTDDLGAVRRREAQSAASALGAARVEFLGYADSGARIDPDVPRLGPVPFSQADADEPARALEAVLRAEHADVVTIYDPRGGYGHPDHVQVHRVGILAAQRAGTPVVLEATVDRRRMWRIARTIARLPRVPADFGADRIRNGYTAPENLTHEIDVRDHARAKRAAMVAHRSQAAGGTGPRTLAILLRLPRPVFRTVLGREWFVEHGRAPGRPLCDDIFASLRTRLAARRALGAVR